MLCSCIYSFFILKNGQIFQKEFNSVNNRLILSAKPKVSRFTLSTEVVHNLTFRLCLIELVNIEAIVKTVTLDIASPNNQIIRCFFHNEITPKSQQIRKYFH